MLTVYKIEAQQLREDAVRVVWRHGSSGTYLVSVNTTAAQVEVACLLPDGEAGAKVCQAHLIDPQLAEDPSVVVLVRKVLENNTVALTATFTGIQHLFLYLWWQIFPELVLNVGVVVVYQIIKCTDAQFNSFPQTFFPSHVT